MASLPAGGAAALTDGYLAGMLAGGAADLFLRPVLDGLAGAAVFAGVCQVLKLDEYLYLKDIITKRTVWGWKYE